MFYTLQYDPVNNMTLDPVYSSVALPLSLDLGGEVAEHAGYIGCDVAVSKHVDVSRTHLQLRGHHRPDARERTQVCHRRQLLERHSRRSGVCVIVISRITVSGLAKNKMSLLFMLNVYQLKDTHALVATEQPNMLGRLQESNTFLEEIQQGLNSYLESKRLFFPRYDYTFTSNS